MPTTEVRPARQGSSKHKVAPAASFPPASFINKWRSWAPPGPLGEAEHCVPELAQLPSTPGRRPDPQSIPRYAKAMFKEAARPGPGTCPVPVEAAGPASPRSSQRVSQGGRSRPQAAPGAWNVRFLGSACTDAWRLRFQNRFQNLGVMFRVSGCGGNTTGAGGGALVQTRRTAHYQAWPIQKADYNSRNLTKSHRHEYKQE